MLADLRAAFAFLTILPVNPTAGRKPGWAFAWFPLVGAVIGALLAGTALLVPPDLRALAIVLLWVVITGGLHLDGFGDSCDGVLATAPPEKRLEIMKDPRTGTWAVVGLVLLLAGKLMLSAQIDPRLLITAPIAGRWAMTTAAYRFAYARPQGLGGYFRDGLAARQWYSASIWAIILIGTIAFAAPIALLATIIAPLATGVIGHWMARRLGGGLTGDSYGALCEMTEFICLVVWAWVS